VKYNPDVHHRKSIRLKDYDYSKEGMYFITICTKDRECILSKIVDREIILSEYGKIVNECIFKISIIYKDVNVDEYIIMPNHIHMVINVGVAYHATQDLRDISIHQKSKMIIPKIIQQFKTATIKIANRYSQGAGLHGMQPLQWQRNYYEHIIRNEKAYFEICEYIKYNPLNWENDSNYKK